MGNRMDAVTAHSTTVWGNGDEVIVFAPGIGGSRRNWQPVAEHFADRYTVVTYDIAGFGECAPTVYDARRHCHPSGYADDIALLLAELDVRGVTFVGHSVSGNAGIVAASTDPGLFSRLVLVCANACYFDDASSGYVGGMTPDGMAAVLTGIDTDYALWTAGFAETVMGNRERPELAGEFGAMLRRTPADVAHTLLRGTFLADIRPLVPRVTVPTLVLQSHADPAVPVAAAQWLADALPHGRLQVLTADGHFPHIVAPDDVTHAIEAFLHEESSGV